MLLPACDERAKQLFIDLLGTVFYGRDVQQLYDPHQKIAVPYLLCIVKKLKHY